MGAASAGMGAALWGMSLVGPQAAVAAADDGSSSSSASASSDSGSSKSEAGQDKSSDAQGEDSDSKDTLGDSDTDSGDDTDSDGTDSDDTFGDTDSGSDDADLDDTDLDDTDAVDLDLDDTEAGATDLDDTGTRDTTIENTTTDDEVTPAPRPSAAPRSHLVPGTTGGQTQPSISAAAVPAVGDPWAIKQVAKAGNPWQANTSAIIAATTSNIRLVILSLPLPQPLEDAFIGTMWTMRRTFFNLAPTMNETYSVSSGLGTIVGQARATDPEGDKIVYRVVKGPRFGTLELNVDGTYTYTPAAEFDGVDTFVIGAVDRGLHVNLIQPFRASGAAASMLVNQNAIDFEFTYNDPDGYFTDEAREQLYQSARRLAVYFLVNQKTVLTYTVNSEFTPDGYLAAAGSDLAGEDAGFWQTVVQQKLIDGVDANGDETDGEIDWNWAWDWGFYPSVGSDDYDFTSTVMHELLHSFGWTSGFRNPGNTEQTAWSIYASFVTTRQEDSPIDDETYHWDPTYDRYLTGFDGGMFFSGANAMAAYGGRPVPLYTPAVWEGGSSISHLDDNVFSGPNHVMMDHAAAGMGPDNIALSPVELGILMDLGYTVVPAPWFAYPPVGARTSVL
ncbi:Ig-like domain-containing protein [Mycobacterium sp. AMU20-3851]|uniref:Ig-like domain-containing protein n=1 Tax=Mycobacterium sp. AMU20-3851 TaxID=3122055 RepID=UPI00375490A5